jgi:hypothetical protein
MVQIERHYALYSLAPKMLFEKFQLIATSSANAAMKVQWLTRWNSSAPIRAARRFLEASVGEDKLILWLAKACWYARMRAHLISSFIDILYLLNTLTYSSKCCMCFVQLIDAAMEYFNSIVAKDNITFTIGGLDGPSTLPAYLELGAYVSGIPPSSKDTNHLGSLTIS